MPPPLLPHYAEFERVGILLNFHGVDFLNEPEVVHLNLLSLLARVLAVMAEEAQIGQ